MSEYDFNHMIPDPYARLPQSAKHRVAADALQIVEDGRKDQVSYD